MVPPCEQGSPPPLLCWMELLYSNQGQNIILINTSSYLSACVSVSVKRMACDSKVCGQIVHWPHPDVQVLICPYSYVICSLVKDNGPFKYFVCVETKGTVLILEFTSACTVNMLGLSNKHHFSSQMRVDSLAFQTHYVNVCLDGFIGNFSHPSCPLASCQYTLA